MDGWGVGDGVDDLTTQESVQQRSNHTRGSSTSCLPLQVSFVQFHPNFYFCHQISNLFFHLNLLFCLFADVATCHKNGSF